MKKLLSFLFLSLFLATPALADCEIAQSSLAGTPISYWRMENNSNDTQGLNNGTDTNMTYNTGKFGSAAIFNGTSAYITTPTTSFPMANSARSISIWYWLDANAEEMLMKYGTRAGNAHAFLYEGYDHAGNWKVYFNSGGAGGDLETNNNISTGAWHHTALTYDGTTLKIWKDGSFDTSRTITLDTFMNSLNYLGAEADIPQAYLNGKMDDVAIFNSVLSTTTIGEINGTCNPVVTTPRKGNVIFLDYLWTNSYLINIS